MVKDLAKKTEVGMLALFSALLLLIMVAPFTLPAGSVTDLSGVVGGLDNIERISDMNPPAAAIYFLGDLNCHQIAERSFYLNGNEMPFCSRDVGIFIGLVAGMAAALFLKPRFSLLALILMAVPILVDGGVQLVTDYESSNLVRIATGMLGGGAASYFLAHIADVYLGTWPSTNRWEKV